MHLYPLYLHLTDSDVLAHGVSYLVLTLYKFNVEMNECKPVPRVHNIKVGIVPAAMFYQQLLGDKINMTRGYLASL